MRGDDEDHGVTYIVGALVFRCSFEDWSEIKKAVLRAGGRIVFERTAPPYARLWIMEGVSDDEQDKRGIANGESQA